MKLVSCDAALLLVMLHRILTCQAAEHGCVPSRLQTLQLDDSNRDETIVPEAFGTPELQECKWKIKVDRIIKDDSPVVLMGVPANGAMDLLGGAVNSTELDIWISGSRSGKSSAVLSGMFWTTHESLRFGRLTFATLTWMERYDEKHQKKPPSVNLRVLIPVPGFCSSDMLSYNYNCHAVSPVNQSVTVAMSRLKGSVQLVSFSSMSQINDFIAANEARLNEFPFARPLDLSRPVRIGLFYNASDGRILSLVNSDWGCELRPVERLAEQFPRASASGACTSLRADASGRPMVQFSDCNAPMPALISFPETAGSATPDCSVDFMQQVAELDFRFPVQVHVMSNTVEPVGMTATTSVSQQPTSKPLVNRTIGEYLAIILCVSIPLAAAVIILAAVYFGRRPISDAYKAVPI